MITSPFHRTGADNREDYAIDIVKLNWSGNRATGIYSQELSSYAIYGESVQSPCSGEVVEVVDGLPENPIGSMMDIKVVTVLSYVVRVSEFRWHI